MRYRQFVGFDQERSYCIAIELCMHWKGRQDSFQLYSSTSRPAENKSLDIQGQEPKKGGKPLPTQQVLLEGSYMPGPDAQEQKL